MKVLGVDPGITTGLAYYDSHSHKVLEYYDTRNPRDIARHIDRYIDHNALDVVVVEDVLGQGPRDSNIIHTIKVLGFAEGYAKHLGVQVVVQPPQVRIHRLEEAEALVTREHGRHYIDAVAHILAYCGLRSRRKSHGKEGSGNRVRDSIDILGPRS